MRAADRPTPPVQLATSDRLARFPMRPVVAVGGKRIVAEWDDPANVWDMDTPGTSRVGTARVGHALVGQV